MSRPRGKNFQKLPPDEKLVIRTVVVTRYRRGESAESLAAEYDVGIRTVFYWIARFAFGGHNGLKDRPRSGRPRKLSDKDMLWVFQTIRDKVPHQLKFQFAVWTLKTVRQLIFEEFDVRLAVSTVWRVLKRLGLTCQRPKHRAYQQDADAAKAWKEEDYPKLVARAKAANAVIVFADEAGLRSDYHVGTTWAERGKTPTVEFTGKIFRINMLSAISPEGKICYMVHEGTANAARFCAFLQEIADAIEGRTIYVVLDNVSIHHAKEVGEWMVGKDMELHFLPTYSPELNPAELVWALVKGAVGKQFVKTKIELKERILEQFEALRAAPEKVQKFFYEPSCSYIVS